MSGECDDCGEHCLECRCHTRMKSARHSMDWKQVLTILGVTGALFFWAISESRADHREIRAELTNFRDAWMAESKDFHARLVAIEAQR